jgi:hypothetical protein
MCCGSTEFNSLYCESEEIKISFAKKLADLDIEKKKAEEYAKLVAETRRGPWERRENAELSGLTSENAEEKTLNAINSTGSAYNVLMLVSWVYKSISDEPSAVKGLQLMCAHSMSGDGCVQLFRHEGVRCILAAYNTHPHIYSIQQSVITITRQLLECNFTRDALIDDTTLLTISFNIGHRNMNEVDLVEHAVASVLQCSRSEVCRREIFRLNIVSYYMIYCKKYSRNANILKHILKLFNWVTSTDQRLLDLYDLGGARTVVKCMERHMNNPAILAPCMVFLTRISSIHPPALEYLVDKQCVPLVIGALKALYAEEVIQLEALKMLQSLSKSEEGWRQISDTRGGWQSIVQGTSQGNALIHSLQGSLHNPGWAIGETPHLPVLERRKLAAAKAMAAKGAVDPKDAWTAHSLRQFMGLSMKHQRLAINLEEHNTTFELLQSLDMLPVPGEEREEWFKRVKEYEAENAISVKDMVQVILDMQRREVKEARMASKADSDAEYVKPVYVMGKKITTKALEEADVDVSQALSGVSL